MIGEVFDGRYRIIRLLGRGGMGSVYEAQHTGTSRRVAVKVVNTRHSRDSEDNILRFQREAKAAGSVDTQHIAQVLDAGTDLRMGAPYMVMELLEGEDLARLLDRAGALPPEVVLRIAAQACVGLHKAHEAGIVHRDIKPANLFLARRDHGEVIVKILDFGIAKIKPSAGEQGEASSLTETGGLLGSPLYLSPEQARSVKRIDRRADLWSLGVVLYRAISGHNPYEKARSLYDLILQICDEPPPPIQDVAPWVPPEVAAILHGALRISPDGRFPDAAAMLDAIKPLLPEGWALREEMLAPLPESARSVVAPRYRGAARERATPARRPRRGAATPSSAPPDSAPRSPPDRGRAAPRAVAAWLVGAACALGLGAFGLSRAVQAPPPPGGGELPAGAVAASAPAALSAQPTAAPSAQPPAAASAQPPAAASAQPTAARPSPDAPPDGASRRVKLVVMPSGVSAEVDGAPARVQDGILDIVGRIGSVHTVRLFRGKDDVQGEVVITESGALPPKMELAPSRPPPARAKVPPPARADADNPLISDEFD
ncbi:protein kinase domain-containing protein [Sorangium sp. So ce131]|uniref:serine/threonine-protein kinase n=1 Tax=Sorangium sp. So ce131 TaxID=3133282 RepID=UPI003F5E1AE3